MGAVGESDAALALAEFMYGMCRKILGPIVQLVCSESDISIVSQSLWLEDVGNLEGVASLATIEIPLQNRLPSYSSN